MPKLFSTLFIGASLFLNFAAQAQNIFPGTGNVGIGTTSPTAPLDVNGSMRLSGFLLNETNDAVTSIRLKPAASNTQTITAIFEAIEKADIGNSASALFGITNSTWGAPLPSVALISTKQGTATAKDIVIWAHDAPSATNAALFIKANTNNVGIGTTDPGDYRLAVKGTIGAGKIKVTQALAWPDFVFDAAYVLPTLQEVERHIKANNHLQGIPSAKEIAREGLDVGEMQQKQMQKIEELTLYLIELNKKLDAQQQVIAEQGKELKALREKGPGK